MPPENAEIQPELIPGEAANIEAQEAAAEGNGEGNGEIQPTTGNETGHISYEEWTASGRDPDKFRGKKAFDEYGEAVKTIKSLNTQFKDVTSTINDLKFKYETDANDRVDKAREDIRVEMNKAREEEDFQAYEAAQAKLDKIKTPVKSAPPEITLDPTISDFLAGNPIIDVKSGQHDQEFLENWTSIYESTLDKFTGGDRTKPISTKQINRAMKYAMTETKELHKDKFVSPRNNRQTTPQNTGRKSGKTEGNFEARLKSMSNFSPNHNDTSAYLDMYTRLKQRNPAAAEKYAKDVLGD